MGNHFFEYLTIIDDFFWSYIGFLIITVMGIYLTFKTKFLQFKILFKPKQTLIELKNDNKDNASGTHPFKLYFASIGGMIGLGNISGVVIAVTTGGPGAIFWLWIASFAGMLIKYSEIFLGVTYRQRNNRGGYDGGPMYYLQAAFGNKYLSILVSILLCIYGAEVYQFTVLSDTISQVSNISKNYIVVLLLVIVIYSAIGGVKRLSSICTSIMPFFLISYIIMCIWIILQNTSEFNNILSSILSSAFSGHAAIGGFAGSSVILAAQQGISRAVYSGDIGIGYDSIIQSETRAKTPHKQARIAIFALLSDTIICTLSCFLVLVTGLWKTTENIQSSEYVTKALSTYFSFANYFTTSLIIIAALSTIIGYLVVGLKCAKYINKKHGEKIYLGYSIFAFSYFAFYDQAKVMIIMSISGGLLLLCNLVGIFRLQNKIKFF